MPLFLVAIKDKELHGEPYIGFAVFDAVDEEAAHQAAIPKADELINAGRGRVHPVVLTQIELGAWHRTGMFFGKASR